MITENKRLDILFAYVYNRLYESEHSIKVWQKIHEIFFES